MYTFFLLFKSAFKWLLFCLFHRKISTVTFIWTPLLRYYVCIDSRFLVLHMYVWRWHCMNYLRKNLESFSEFYKRSNPVGGKGDKGIKSNKAWKGKKASFMIDLNLTVFDRHLISKKWYITNICEIFINCRIN